MYVCRCECVCCYFFYCSPVPEGIHNLLSCLLLITNTRFIGLPRKLPNLPEPIPPPPLHFRKPKTAKSSETLQRAHETQKTSFTYNYNPFRRSPERGGGSGGGLLGKTSETERSHTDEQPRGCAVVFSTVLLLHIYILHESVFCPEWKHGGNDHVCEFRLHQPTNQPTHGTGTDFINYFEFKYKFSLMACL